MHLRFTGPVAFVCALLAHRHALAAAPCSPDPSSALVKEAVARFPAAPELEMGALGDAMLGKLVEAACPEAARPWLPSTCASPGPQGMTDLRRRLVGDMARLPAAMLAKNPEARTGVQAGLAVVETLLADGSMETLAKALAGSMCGAAPSAADGDLARAGRVLARVATVAAIKDVDELTRQIEAAVVAEAIVKEGEVLSPARRNAVKSLAEALAKGGSAVSRVFDVAQASIALVKDAPVAVPTGWAAGIVALAQGDADSAVKAQVAVLSDLGLPNTAAVADAVRTGVRLASARSRDEALRFLRGMLLGPWSDPFLLDLSLVTPIISRENVTFGGDFAIGYAGQRFGLRAHGGFGSYNLDDGRILSLVNKAGGGGDFWFTLGDSATRFDARFAAELTLYHTSIIDRDDGSGASLGDESALDYRASTMLGVRYEPNARFAMAFWVGGGLQYEFHNPKRLTTGDFSLSLAQTHSASLLLQSRLRAQYLVVPGWLALRLQSELQRNAKASAAIGLKIDSTGLKFDAGADRAIQIEWRTRLFFDAEVGRFFGIVPGVTTGLDFIRLSAERSASAVVPEIGVGIRRTAL